MSELTRFVFAALAIDHYGLPWQRGVEPRRVRAVRRPEPLKRLADDIWIAERPQPSTDSRSERG
jgi:hypothetical protein